MGGGGGGEREVEGDTQRERERKRNRERKREGGRGGVKKSNPEEEILSNQKGAGRRGEE